jgi:hypothetical protein
MAPPQSPNTASSAPRPYPAPRPHLIVVDGPIPEPLGQRASRLIGTGTAGIAMAGIAVLITWLVPPETPVRWLVLLTAAVCVVLGPLCISVGVTVHVGPRYAREARRRRPPEPRPPANDRARRRPVVIDGSFADPGDCVPTRSTWQNHVTRCAGAPPSRPDRSPHHEVGRGEPAGPGCCQPMSHDIADPHPLARMSGWEGPQGV